MLAWVLILHVLHLPVPFPDLDGECRGAPILSLFEWQAWHVLMIGIRPSDDIDRGPIHSNGDSRTNAADDTPFGGLAIVAASSAITTIAWDALCPTSSDQGLEATVGDFTACRLYGLDRTPIVPSARAACVYYCSWQV
jgi:hypothetical protein